MFYKGRHLRGKKISDSFHIAWRERQYLRLRGLVDGDLTVDAYVNIDFEVCRSETNAMTDREIPDSISINDYAEAKEETDEESNDVQNYPKAKKAKIIRYSTCSRVTWMLVSFW